MKKEQQKQRLEKYSERFNNKENELIQGIFNPENWGNRLVNEQQKQETLEEVAERLYPVFMELGNCTIEHDSNEELREAFIDGAKWQQQQNKNLYSEEEVYKKLHNLMTSIKLDGLVINDDMDLKQWFEQFKKK